MRLPIRGLAGAVIQTNRALNVPDAYQDERFDATMDRRTGYRTRQVLGVPLRHSLTGETIGLLQVNYRLDNVVVVDDDDDDGGYDGDGDVNGDDDNVVVVDDII